MTAIPIPQRCAARPTQGGLVVPWISVQLGDAGYDLGNMHTSKVNQCFYMRRCQICGDPILGRIVFFLPESALDARWAGEPPLHPECASYSARACPMLAGGMRTYRKFPSRSEGNAGKHCNKPGCDCAGWRVSQDSQDRERGRPAEPWHAVWCADYTLTCPDEETRLLVESGAVPTGVSLGARIGHPLKVRPVRADTTTEWPGMTAPEARCELTELLVRDCAHCRPKPPPAKPEVAYRFEAMYPGRCSVCDFGFDEGARIGRLLDGDLACPDCCEELT